MRIGDIDKSGTGIEADDGVFIAGDGVGPAPDVTATSVCGGIAELGKGELAEEIDIVAGVDIGEAIGTGGVGGVGGGGVGDDESDEGEEEQE